MGLGVRGIVKKAIRGAAAGVDKAMPLIAENQRHANRKDLQTMINEAVAKRDAKLQGYRQQEQATQNEFVAGQNQADREQRQTQYDAQNAFALAGLANDNARTSAQLRQIETAIEGSQLELQDQRRLRDLFTGFGSLPDDQKESAIEEMLLLQGKDPRLKNEFRVVKQYDDYGDQIGEVLVELSPSGGAHRRIDVDGMGGSSGNPQSSGIPQAAIQDLIRDPSSEARREFDEVFGAGASESILGASAPAPTNSPERVPESDQPVQTQANNSNSPPREISSSEIEQMGYVPDGYVVMTSGKAILQSGNSSDWNGSEFVVNPDAIEQRAKEIYRRMNVGGSYDAEAMSRAMAQARREINGPTGIVNSRLN